MNGFTGNLRASVFGAGYLGATHASCLAELGFDVIAIDSDVTRIKALSSGKLPFFEPGMDLLLRRGIGSRRLHFSTSYQEAARFADVHFICVGTPQYANSYHADLSQLSTCISTLGPLLESPCLVVGKSTVPVGTAVRLAAELTRLAPAREAAELAWNPEFLREGSAVEDTLRPDRIVAGVQSRHAERILQQIYATPLSEGSLFFSTDLATAELAKTAANSFLATKISFINAMAEVCGAAGGDASVLAEILGADPRIGKAFLRPGLGFGGSCLPKDIRAFMARATELGTGDTLAFLRDVDSINLRCRTRMVELARALVGGEFVGRTVGVLGIAFKPGSDDIRDSPALEVATAIHALGARVRVYDPVAMPKARQSQPQLEYARSAESAACGADALLLLTEWPEFCDLDPDYLGNIVTHRKIADGRNALVPELWRQANWDYHALGRPASNDGIRRIGPSLNFVPDTRDKALAAMDEH